MSTIYIDIYCTYPKATVETNPHSTHLIPKLKLHDTRVR